MNGHQEYLPKYPSKFYLRWLSLAHGLNLSAVIPTFLIPSANSKLIKGLLNTVPSVFLTMSQYMALLYNSVWNLSEEKVIEGKYWETILSFQFCGEYKVIFHSLYRELNAFRPALCFSLNSSCEDGDEKWDPRWVLHQLLHSSFKLFLLFGYREKKTKDKQCKYTIQWQYIWIHRQK